jgi:hypothetical protein
LRVIYSCADGKPPHANGVCMYVALLLEQQDVWFQSSSLNRCASLHPRICTLSLTIPAQRHSQLDVILVSVYLSGSAYSIWNGVWVLGASQIDPLFPIGDVYSIKDLDTFIMNWYVLYTLSIFGDVPQASAVTSTTNNSVGYNHSLEVLQTSDWFHSWRRARYYIARPLLHLNDDHCPLRFVKERTSHAD